MPEALSPSASPMLGVFFLALVRSAIESKMTPSCYSWVYMIKIYQENVVFRGSTTTIAIRLPSFPSFRPLALDPERISSNSAFIVPAPIL